MSLLFDPALYAGTPAVRVSDNRGLAVRELAWHRVAADGMADIRITCHRYDGRSLCEQSADPRLYDAMQADPRIKPNFLRQHGASGKALRTESADAGCGAVLHDAAGRPCWAVTPTGVTQTWQYEAAPLPGRLSSISERDAGEATARVTERWVWAGNSTTEKERNLVGRAVRHYDPAGLLELLNVPLRGEAPSQSRRLLRGEQEPDWRGTDESTWQDALGGETYVTRTTTDSTGALLTRTDARGNRQRLAYDVAGRQKGSWLTPKGQRQQAIVTALTWSADGLKLREAHGNGVTIEYGYGPADRRLSRSVTKRISDAKALRDLRYEYDPVGNVLSVRDVAAATHFWRNQQVEPVQTYAYDTLYQLTRATGREMVTVRS